MTKGEAYKEIDEHLLTPEVNKHKDEYGIPLYHIEDTGLSIDIIFDDPAVGDISVEYVPKPPYIFNREGES